MLAEVCEKAKARVEAKHQTLTLRGSARVPAWIAGDRSSVRRLFWTLLDNAVKYTPENGRIEVTVTTQEQDVQVRVKDSGIGIPADLLPRVFERFFRVDASRGEADGTGLGLAIAKWIADAHQATLSAESVEGEGTVFEVRFQAVAQHALNSAGPATKRFTEASILVAGGHREFLLHRWRGRLTLAGAPPGNETRDEQ